MPSPLTPAELARYSRHLSLEGVGIAGQQQLAAARVLVVGVGGLGSPAALYLAAAGVGTLGLADFDDVEEHNLQRQIVHDTAAVGEPKLDSAARRLAALNPHLRLQRHDDGITPANALGIFAGYDLILDGSDNFSTRYLVNDAAFFARKPFVHGSVFKFSGQVGVFDPARGGPCYRCAFPAPPPAGSVPDCGEAGVFGALCGVIGSLQAMEAIKLLTGAGEPLRGRMLIHDSLTQTFQTLNLARDRACPLCGEAPAISGIDVRNYDGSCAPVPAADPRAAPLEIEVEEARALLAADPGAVLLDVREDHELEICRVDGARWMPMREIPGKLDELPRDRPILALCHVGVRSLQVTRFLRANGFDRASNVAGGIDAWAARLDPALPRY